MISHLFHKTRFAILKQKIRRNPHIGTEDIDGTYDYKQGSYSIRYCIVKLSQGKESIKWVSQRRRLSPYEEKREKIGRKLSNFWHYQGWLIFFRPPIIFLLLISIFIFYFGLMETQKAKVERYKWVVASVIGISTNQIQYIGDGWLEISAQRKTAGDRINEPIRYRFNPFRWFFSPEADSITRWRGGSYGYATYPVVYNGRGEVWINKEGRWEYGRISGKAIEWHRPVGSRKVTGQDISIQDEKLYIQDK